MKLWASLQEMKTFEVLGRGNIQGKLKGSKNEVEVPPSQSSCGIFAKMERGVEFAQLLQQSLH